MHRHAASCLRGPVTQARGCWRRADAAEPADPFTTEVPSLSDPDIRADLVRRVRRAIAEGTYETPEKWQAALDQLGKELD